MTDPAIELSDLVDQLTAVHDEPVHLLGQRLGHREQRPLLHRLAEASVPTISSGGRGTALGSRLAFDPAASELHTAITDRIRAWARHAGVPPYHWANGTTDNPWPDPARLLRAWHARTLNTPPERWIPTLAGWTTAIRDLVTDPPRRWTLDATCPQCHERWTINSDGERVDTLHVALRDATDTWTTCRNCGALWTGLTGAEQLANLIAGNERAQQLLDQLIARQAS